MTQAVIPQALTAETGFDPSSVHLGFTVDEMALGQSFLSVFPCQYHYNNAPNSYLSTINAT